MAALVQAANELEAMPTLRADLDEAVRLLQELGDLDGPLRIAWLARRVAFLARMDARK